MANNSVASGNIVNGTIVNDDISSSAAIEFTKLENLDSAKILVGNGSNKATEVAVSGDVTISNAGVVTIGSGVVENGMMANNSVASGNIVNDTIQNTDINTGAAIEFTKLENLDSAKILVGNGSNKAAEVAMSGDATIDNTGAVTIAAGAVETSMIAADAIDGTRIADNAIGSEHIAANAVTLTEIADNSVGNGAMADNAINTAELVDDAVTVAKIDMPRIETLAGMESGTASVLAGSGVSAGTALTANIDELNLLDGKSIVTTIGASPTDVQIPTAQAVDERVIDLVTDVGGFRPIANETSFPATNPDPEDNAGTIVSIKALASNLTSNGSGVATIANGAGSGNTVTINGMANNDTIEAGKGILVETTSTLHTYTFHRETLAPADVTAAQTAVNDFNERYRILASGTNINTVGSLDDGDLLWDSNVDKMKVYDATASAWKEVTSTGEFKYLFLCPSNGSGAPTYGGASYDLREGSNSGSEASVTNAAQLLVSINGVIQKANTGTSAPSEGFAMVDGNSIIFGSNIASTDNVFIVQIGSAVSIPTPGDDTVSTIKIQNLAVNSDKLALNAVSTAKIADQAVDLTKLPHGDGTSNGKFLRSNNGADPTWETVATDLAGDSTPQLGGDLDVNGNDIVSTSNANIDIVPNGTGDVTLQADTVQVGDSNADVAITTNGTGDLTLSTNSGTNSGTIEIEDGADNDIVITPNGTGDVILDGLKYPQADGSANQVLKTDGSGQLSWTTVSGGAALTGSLNNTICTVTGANAIQGESTFTYDGKDLAIGVTGETGWASDATSVQIGGLGAIWGKTTQSAGAGIEVGYNVYDDNSTGNAYIITDEATKYRQDDGHHYFYTASSGTADAAITFSERLKIANDGFISIGGDADTGVFLPSGNKFAVKANNYENFSVEYNRIMCMYNGNSSGNHARLNFQDANSGANVMIYQNQTVGNNAVFHRFEHNEGVVGDISQDGSNMHYGGTSDYRRKQDDVAIDNGITKVKQLRPIRFKWKDDTSRVVDGFLAHEVASVVPEAVKGEKDAVVTQAMVDAGIYEEDRLGKEVLQQFDPGKLIPVLTAALKEPITKIETLETKVAALEAG